MSLWRQLSRGLRSLTHSRAAEQDLSDEVQHYFDEAVQAGIAAGSSPAEARRAALLAWGHPSSIRDRVRESGWEAIVSTTLADLRYALRRLRRAPGFVGVSVLTLALGIGATTAIFSAVNPILFQPLPYPNPSGLIAIWYAGEDGTRIDQAFGTYREVVQRSRALNDAAVMKSWLPTLTDQGQPERLEGQRVSASYFRVLGVAPAIGRDFDAADDRSNGPRVVVIGDALWRRRFQGDPAVVGRLVKLDGDDFTVVGVMPRTLETVLAPSAEVWAPLQYDMSQGRAWGHHLRMIGRLRPGVTLEGARDELATIARDRVAEFSRVPWAALEQGFIVTALQDDVTAAVRPALLAVLIAVSLLLVIACVNVTNLLLARGAERRSEMAVRAALGAAPGRLVRQLLTESVVLAVLGGTLGVAIAGWGLQWLIAIAPPGLSRASAIQLDVTVLVFAFALSALIGVGVGIIPAIHATRTDLHGGVQQGSHRTATAHQTTRRLLVIAEVALALVLLASAGLLLRSLQRLFAIDPGFTASHVLTMQVQTAGRRFDKPTTDRFFERSLDAVRAVPGVEAAAYTSQLPLSGDDDEYGAHFEGDSSNAGYNVFRYAVSPGYFEALRIPLERGRFLDKRDTADAPRAVVISATLARRKFAHRDPIGQRVHIGPTDQPWYTVVGVVGDIKQASLAASQPDAVYITPTQSWFVDSALSLVVRSTADTRTMTPIIKQAVWSIDKDQPIVRIATMDALVARTAADRRFALILFELFGIVALALAATGIYGVVSGGVAERVKEIGVRAALGASRRSIQGLILRQGMALTAAGLVLGLAGSLAAGRVLLTLLFEITPLDPLTYASVTTLLVAVSAIACWLPAWRAARVDPCIALRSE